MDDSTVNVKNNKQENDYRVNSQISDAEDFIELSHENTDGTIVLTDDGENILYDIFRISIYSITQQARLYRLNTIFENKIVYFSEFQYFQ